MHVACFKEIHLPCLLSTESTCSAPHTQWTTFETVENQHKLRQAVTTEIDSVWTDSLAKSFKSDLDINPLVCDDFFEIF